MKQRKLSSYYQFIIDISSGYVKFTNIDGTPFPSYREKLTKAQWKKASKYLDRKLIPFCGYQYTPKNGITKNMIIQ